MLFHLLWGDLKKGEVKKNYMLKSIPSKKQHGFIKRKEKESFSGKGAVA